MRVFPGAGLARGRRTAPSWTRTAGSSAEFRPAYTTAAAAGRRADGVAARPASRAGRPPAAGAGRLTLALDGAPTPRSGPHVQGAGVRHTPTPGPAGPAFASGHGWGVLGLLVGHPAWGAVALPLLARLYVRAKDPASITDPDFQQLVAVQVLHWAVTV